MYYDQDHVHKVQLIVSYRFNLRFIGFRTNEIIEKIMNDL